MRRTRTALALTSTLLIVGLLLAGCGDDTSSAQDPGPTADATSSTSEEPADEPAEEPSEDAEEESPEEAEEPSEKPRPVGPFADLTFRGDSAKPNGERLEVELGKPLTLRIDSDRPGELHVHSTPEQEISFPAGQSERKLTIDQPGVVDVEDHDSGLVLLQLEVR